METTIWKQVKGWEGFYEVSNTGLVKSLARRDRNGRFREECILKSTVSTAGYLMIGMHVNRVGKSNSIHRIMAEAFLGDPAGRDVNHKDGNKQNNNLNNLEYVSRQENIRHAWENGLSKPRRGEQAASSKLKNSQVKEIKNLLAQGLSLSKIGRIYGVGAATISDIKLGRTWTVLNGN